MKNAALARVDLERFTGDGPDRAAAVVEIYLKDGRQFTLLAATPQWFASETARLGLAFYFGPAVLFLKKVDAATAKKAAKELLAGDEQVLVRYDTPRRDLVEVLTSFRATHP